MKKIYFGAVFAIAWAASMGFAAHAEEATYQPVTHISDYTLADTKQGEDFASITYTAPAGQSFTVTYTTAAYTSAKDEKPLFLFEPLPYRCYGSENGAKQIAAVHYTAGEYSVTLQSSVPQTRNEMLSLTEQVQALPAPFCTLACPDCGAAIMQDMGFTLGKWEQTGTKNCGHGGANLYNDVQQTRTVTHTWICPTCHHTQVDTAIQKAEYCYYGNRTYIK